MPPSWIVVRPIADVLEKLRRAPPFLGGEGHDVVEGGEKAEGAEAVSLLTEHRRLARAS